MALYILNSFSAMDAFSTNTSASDVAHSSGTANASGDNHEVSQTSLLRPTQDSVSSDESTFALEDEALRAAEVHSTLLTPNNPQGYQPSEEYVAESTEPSREAAADPVDNFESPPAAPGSPWRPNYLRRRVLAAFSVIFLLVIALLEVLNVLSTRNGGIAKGHNTYHYLWTYGPTAFLTLIAALFNQVEYQAKLMAPWERLSKHPRPAQQNLLLDYISSLQPVAIYESLKNKDFAVAATTTISLVIKILIVLSSGLITLSRITVHHTAMPMEIQNAFVDDASPLRTTNSLPYFIMKGLMGGNSYPPGITDEFAYQSVQSNLPETAQYEVIVDGLITNLQCELVNLVANNYATRLSQNSDMNLTITSPGCEVVISHFEGPWPPSIGPDQLFEMAFGKLEPVQCDGTADDAGKRLLFVLGLHEWFVNETLSFYEGGGLQGRLIKSAQLLCAPQYEIKTV